MGASEFSEKGLSFPKEKTMKLSREPEIFT
jgi:hypothetical protein